MEELKKQIEELSRKIDLLYNSANIPHDVEQAFRTRLGNLNVPDGLASAPLPAITGPSGGITVDTEARIAINTVITDLKTLGLTL